MLQYDMGKTIQGQGFRPSGFLNQPPMLLLSAVNGLRSEYELYEGDHHKIVETVGRILQKNNRLSKKYGKPDPSTDLLYVSAKVHTDREKSCNLICGQEKRDIVQRPERVVEDGDDELVIFYGLIGSGNQVMRDATVRDRLAAERNVLCFEMEAAGLMNHFPCLVIRGTSATVPPLTFLGFV